MVLAFPKASRAGLAWMIWSSRVPWFCQIKTHLQVQCQVKLQNVFQLLEIIFNWSVIVLYNWYFVKYSEVYFVVQTFFSAARSFFALGAAAMLAKYWMTRLVLTVFPAPDSPLSWRETEGFRPRPMTLNYLRDYFWLCDLRDKDWLVFSVCQQERFSKY